MKKTLFKHFTLVKLNVYVFKVSMKCFDISVHCDPEYLV